MKNEAPLATAPSVVYDNIDKDLYDIDEQYVIGSIVSTYSHPFQTNNTNVVITAYNHFTPPLMVIVEKKYSISKYNTETAEPENNDQCKCVYYCTQSGNIVESWFKTTQLKHIKKIDLPFYVENKGRSLSDLNGLLGDWAILNTVDLELGKKQTWLDEGNPTKKLKTKALLDFLPPLGAIIDFKFNDDYKKFNEKNGKTLHRKSKLLVKLRWWNNHSSKFSEEYFPMVALRRIDKSDLLIKKFSSIYLKKSETTLLENTSIATIKKPYKLEEVVWKHYYYLYKLRDLFTGETTVLKKSKLDSISEISELDPDILDSIFTKKNQSDIPPQNFFNNSDQQNFIHRWFKIEYLDKMNRFSQRIVRVYDIITEDLILPSLEIQKRTIIRANCLLRNGNVRHFNVSRVLSYAELPNEFVSYFVSDKEH